MAERDLLRLRRRLLDTSVTDDVRTLFDFDRLALDGGIVMLTIFAGEGRTLDGLDCRPGALMLLELLVSLGVFRVRRFRLVRVGDRGLAIRIGYFYLHLGIFGAVWHTEGCG